MKKQEDDMVYVYGINVQGIAELALPVELDQELLAALDGDNGAEIQREIEDRVNAKIREYGVTDEEEWLGEWSPADIVRDVLARYQEDPTMIEMRSAQTPGFIRGVSASTFGGQ